MCARECVLAWPTTHKFKFKIDYQMGTVEKIQEAQQGKGIATILAIGTANPPTSILQSDYPDFYFRVTGSSDHMPDLEHKFRKICANSAVRKRHMLHNEDMLKQNPSMCTYGAPSFDTRQSILYEEVPKLGKEAALKAINEWGQPISKITHLIFYTTSSFGNVPGADYHLSILLGLHPTVNRLMIFNLGCYAGGTLLRLAKDITENNAGSRVLAVCVETMAASFHGPSATHLDILVGQALFGDGAAAMIIGADPNPHIESPLFELVLASQTTIPETEKGIHGGPREMGMVYYLAKAVPTIVSENVEKCLVDAFSSIGNISDWNSLFYAVHPGGPAILRKIEEKLGLKKEKLRASKHVLTEYGNMWSSSVIFVLDEMRRNSMSEGKTTTGEGLEWGVLLGLGPGLTVETVVLRSISLN